MKINKLIIKLIFTCLFILIVTSSDTAPPKVSPLGTVTKPIVFGGIPTPIIEDTPKKNETTPTPSVTVKPTPTPSATVKPTPTPTPSATLAPVTTTPNTTTTPTPNPYANGKFIVKVNIASIVNYKGYDCGNTMTPCKSLNDGFQKFISFKSENPSILITQLEFLISYGIYNKSTFQEIATKLNLYELNVNISFIALNNGQEDVVVFDGYELLNPLAIINSKDIKPTGLDFNTTISFDGITFRNWNDSKLLEISITSGANSSSSILDSNNNKLIVLFRRCSFLMILNNNVDFISSQVGKLGWVELWIEQSHFYSVSAHNVFNLKNTVLIFRNGSGVLNGRSSESFIKSESSLIQIESASFKQYVTSEGLIFTKDSSVSINQSEFVSNFGTFSSIISYSGNLIDLNITKVHFESNMVTNNGGIGDSIIIIENKGENGEHHGRDLPKRAVSVDVQDERYKASIVNCTFLTNNTPKSLNSGLIWVSNAILFVSGSDITIDAINDHGPAIISHHSTVEIVNSKLFGGISSYSTFPPIVANYSSVRVERLTWNFNHLLPFKCDSSLIIFDYNSGVNASLFMCDNIHKAEYNSSYASVHTSHDINSFSCEILQIPSSLPNVKPSDVNVICSNESETKYKYDFKITKAVIAIIVIGCTFLTLIPVVILANKIYKNLYKGYIPHEGDEPDLEEFSINNNSNNNTTSGGGIDRHNNINDGFHDVPYEDDTLSSANKSLLK